MEAAKYLDSEVIEKMKNLLLAARFPVAGAFTGYHRSLLKGSAMEFAELRNYMPGDDLRRMDWKAYGRSDKFFLKEYESETNARAYFLLDTSGSMGFLGRDQVSRLYFAKKLIAHLSLLLLEQGDSVGVAQRLHGELVAQRVRGEVNLHRILSALDSQPASGEERLGEQLHQLSRNLPRRSMVIIVSDFLTSLPELEEALQHMRYHAHEITCLQVLSERELRFDEEASKAFTDLETGEILQTNVDEIRELYREGMNTHLQELKQICERSQTQYHRLVSEEPLEESILNLLSS